MSKIHVVLFDAGANCVLGEVDLAANQLPESFAAATQMHIGDADWQVERAEPVTQREFVATGHLRLVLRKIKRVDPRSILFSLATLENASPPTLGPIDDAVTMHEDDWRQRELVSARFEPEIAAELAAIRTIHAEHRKGPGFTSLHVRQRIPHPLDRVALTVHALSRLGPRRALAIGPSGEVHVEVAGGFAFVVGTGVIYGREEDGAVVVLGLSPDADPAPLAALARTHDLVLVSWCDATQQSMP